MSKRAPFVIGVTGNIGTGKSTVAQMLGDLGATVVDADLAAHIVIRAGTPAFAQIVETFGPQIIGSDGEINRKALAAVVFAEPAMLARLEAIVHPPTVAAIGAHIAASAACGPHRTVVVVEAIKLIESGIAATCDSVWVVECRTEQQIERVLERGLTRADVEHRARFQSSQAEKIARADIVIDNSGSRARTRAQVRAAWERVAPTTWRNGQDCWPHTQAPV